MPLTPTLLAAVPFAIWLYLFIARGNFWQVQEDTAELKSPKRWPRVVGIVPARDEAETISRSVASLAKQNYPGEFSVVVVDDHSSDGPPSLRGKPPKKPPPCEELRFVPRASFLAAGPENCGP